MLIYIILYLLTIIICFLEINITSINIGTKQLRMSDISFGVLFIYVLFLGIMRGGSLGADSINYKDNYWEVYKTLSFFDALKWDSDWGYGLVNWLIGKFVSEFWAFRAILFSVTFIMIATWIRKHSKYVSMSFLIYLSFGYLGFEFAILRQALAVSIFVWSYDFLIERKPVKFVLLILMAALCHKTAVFMLIEYPLLSSRIKNGKRIIRVGYFIGAILMMMVSGKFVTFFYLRNDYSDSLGIGGEKLLLYCICFFFILEYLIWKIKYDKKIVEGYQLATSIIYFQIIAIAVSIVTRMLMYSVTYLFILIPAILAKFGTKTKNTVVVLFICMLIVLFIKEVDAYDIVPYATWF